MAPRALGQFRMEEHAPTGRGIGLAACQCEPLFGVVRIGLSRSRFVEHACHGFAGGGKSLGDLG